MDAITDTIQGVVASFSGGGSSQNSGGSVSDVRGLNDDYVKYSCGTDEAKELPCKNIIQAMSKIGYSVQSGVSDAGGPRFIYFENAQQSGPMQLVEKPDYDKAVGTLEDRSQCVRQLPPP
jgi:hypothetical protein